MRSVCSPLSHVSGVFAVAQHGRARAAGGRLGLGSVCCALRTRPHIATSTPRVDLHLDPGKVYARQREGKYKNELSKSVPRSRMHVGTGTGAGMVHSATVPVRHFCHSPRSPRHLHRRESRVIASIARLLVLPDRPSLWQLQRCVGWGIVHLLRSSQLADGRRWLLGQGG